MSSAQEKSARVGVALVTLVAAGILVGWYVALTAIHPTFIGDEQYYVPLIRALAHGQWDVAEHPSMLPTFFLLTSFGVRIVGESLWVLRGLTVFTGIATLTVFGVAIWRRYPREAGARVLLLALNPLLLPLWALVYTDVLTLLLVCLGLLLMIRRHHLGSAFALLAASAIRQSTLVWLVAFATLAIAQWWAAQPHRPPPWHPRFWLMSFRPVWWPYAAAGVLVVALVALAGDRIMPDPINGPRFNPAQLYGLALAGSIIWAPVWLWELGRAWHAHIVPRLMKPHWCAAIVSAVGIVALAFTNPHPWNSDTNFLRNWALVALENSLLLRFMAGALIVVAGALLIRHTWHSPARAPLGWIWLFTLLFLLPHYLVDPRYYIIPIVLIDFFTPYRPRQVRVLAGWYALLAVGVGAYVLLRPGGGMW